tara:strand:- start:1211 stop:1996 length:786 start_codon:yes stop_codon:yes gene_type:complete
MAETLNTHEEEKTDANAEHDKEMLEKAEQLESNSNRPEWLPEKFKSAEELVASYTELEKKLGQGSEVSEGQEETITEEQRETIQEQETEVAKVMDKAGLDFEVFQKEYDENGELSDKAYEALNKAGFPKTLVDTWISGQQALQSDLNNQMFQSVGGEETYLSMLEWAKETLPESDISAFNTSVETGDPNLVKFAVQGLYARYRSEAGGNEPQLTQGVVNETSGGSFQSAAELTAAMRDPRYANDPAYRKNVANKLSRSSVF